MKSKLKKCSILVAMLFTMMSCASGGSPDIAPGGGGEGNTPIIQGEGHAIIYEINYEISSKDIKKTIGDVNQKVGEVSGYISSSSQDEDYAYYVYKVPVEQLQNVLDYIDAFEGIGSKGISTVEVTESIRDLESQIEVLQARKESYESVLKTETNLSLGERLQINDKIDSLNTQIVNLQKQLTDIENSVQFSTITIRYRSIDPSDNPFATYGTYLLHLVEYIGIALLYSLPFIVIAGVVCLIIFLRKKKMNS